MAEPLADVAFQRAQQFYSPHMLVKLLPGLPSGIFRRPPQQLMRDRVLGDRPRWDWHEEQMIIACDLKRALAQLKAVSPIHAIVVFRYGALRSPRRERGDPHCWAAIAADTGYHWETIKNCWFDGIDWLARWLGWEGGSSSWFGRAEPRAASGDVWRKEAA